jgi:hypothetical protein
MEPQSMTTIHGSDVPAVFNDSIGEVVEIALLLPTNRAQALVALSRRRRQSVGQILRQLIDRALAGEETVATL